ncbi:hypothetical protein Tco_1061190, partial [Tanacetum coccineum]
MLRGLKKTHGEKEICTKTCLKEAQSPLTYGCHVGNPCTPQSNPTMEREHPKIEGMKGQDLWERLPTSKAQKHLLMAINSPSYSHTNEEF